MADYDVIVVGAGNAAFAAAVSARESGADKVLVLEKADQANRGGNTHFSGGILRFAFDDPQDIAPLLPNVDSDYLNFFEGVQPYTPADFKSDLMRVTRGRTDPELSDYVIANSKDVVFWAHDYAKIAMEPAHSIAGVEKNGVIYWPKGAIVRTEHEGVGLTAGWFKCAERDGVEIRYETGATRIIIDKKGRAAGVTTRSPAGIEDITANAVILACGGFEANAQWRAQYLGGPWGHAKVRGTAHNQGDGLRMALDIGALPYGHWGGCHATPISAEWGDFADRRLTDKSNRLSYLFGVMINRLGRRFVDEGEDTQFYTYAKFGGEILHQPGGVAYQIFDQRTVHLLEPRYETSTPITANTLAELVEKLDLEDRPQALATLNAYNAACGDPEGFDPTEKDGLTTTGAEPEKTNWATPLDSPPYAAYSATGGVTFTFGGLKVDTDARVIATDWRPIDGLYACGEMVGGLFHYNYPGGTGLVSGMVMGRAAGRSAARQT